MPAGTRAERIFRRLIKEGKDPATAARIAQKRTGTSLKTGKRPKRK